jgi:hypothetical protein
MQLNQKFVNNKEENNHLQNQSPDYREQYIKNDQTSQRDNQLNQEQSFTSMPCSDFELNFLNETKTSFFSPSTFSLPNDDVQYTTDYSSKNANSTNHGSILIHNFSVQENQKLFHAP